MSYASRRQQELADFLVRSQRIQSPSVEAAFRGVARHLFAPEVALDLAYTDTVVAAKFAHGVAISSLSQPSMIATMLEMLDLQSGQRVLEIGAGTGYNAALMAHIVGPTGHVVTLDIDQDLCDDARAHLEAANVRNVAVICADGGYGYAAGAPYDRIILTVGAWDIAPAWWDQLAPHGRLVIPLAIRTVQKTLALINDGEQLRGVDVADCGFIRLRGAFAGPEAEFRLGAADGEPILLCDEPDLVDLPALRLAMQQPATEIPLNILAAGPDLWGGLGLWLAARQPGCCQLLSRGFSLGVVDGGTLYLLTSDFEGMRLTLLRHGPGSATQQRLIDDIFAWRNAGRPISNQASFTIRRRDTPREPQADEIVIDKQWTSIAIRWR